MEKSVYKFSNTEFMTQIIIKKSIHIDILLKKSEMNENNFFYFGVSRDLKIKRKLSDNRTAKVDCMIF